MKIVRLKKVNKNSVADINHLGGQQTGGKSTKLTKNQIEKTLKNPLFHMLVVVDKKKIIGMGTIYFQKNLHMWISEIHDIVVDEKYRGQGIGKKIMKELLKAAKRFAKSKKSAIQLSLTSRPSRVVANKLYKKIGFIWAAQSKGILGTNLYKKIIFP